eukprot:CAMPEP_0117738414 /NCGR_PEP_ID=MMETSP0947-20121206/3113_1 /TAXON_ID=44440 /ORGANISM="Chattonella subsalsa, Strain CCMP2191" /LENGTH=1003 /DNA_ID=CAMNT_0005554095 /DNA_START=162 /DNA_END=3170 /DNA_ORIENTATION=-
MEEVMELEAGLDQELRKFDLLMNPHFGDDDLAKMFQTEFSPTASPQSTKGSFYFKLDAEIEEINRSIEMAVNCAESVASPSDSDPDDSDSDGELQGRAVAQLSTMMYVYDQLAQNTPGDEYFRDIGRRQSTSSVAPAYLPARTQSTRCARHTSPPIPSPLYSPQGGLAAPEMHRFSSSPDRSISSLPKTNHNSLGTPPTPEWILPKHARTRSQPNPPSGQKILVGSDTLPPQKVTSIQQKELEPGPRFHRPNHFQKQTSPSGQCSSPELFRKAQSSPPGQHSSPDHKAHLSNRRPSSSMKGRPPKTPSPRHPFSKQCSGSQSSGNLALDESRDFHPKGSTQGSFSYYEPEVAQQGSGENPNEFASQMPHYRKRMAFKHAAQAVLLATQTSKLIKEKKRSSRRGISGSPDGTCEDTENLREVYGKQTHRLQECLDKLEVLMDNLSMPMSSSGGRPLSPIVDRSGMASSPDHDKFPAETTQEQSLKKEIYSFLQDTSINSTPDRKRPDFLHGSQSIESISPELFVPPNKLQQMRGGVSSPSVKAAAGVGIEVDKGQRSDLPPAPATSFSPSQNGKSKNCERVSDQNLTKKVPASGDPRAPSMGEITNMYNLSVQTSDSVPEKQSNPSILDPGTEPTFAFRPREGPAQTNNHTSITPPAPTSDTVVKPQPARPQWQIRIFGPEPKGNCSDLESSDFPGPSFCDESGYEPDNNHEVRWRIATPRVRQIDSHNLNTPDFWDMTPKKQRQRVDGLKKQNSTMRKITEDPPSSSASLKPQARVSAATKDQAPTTPSASASSVDPVCEEAVISRIRSELDAMFAATGQAPKIQVLVDNTGHNMPDFLEKGQKGSYYRNRGGVHVLTTPDKETDIQGGMNRRRSAVSSAGSAGSGSGRRRKKVSEVSGSQSSWTPGSPLKYPGYTSRGSSHSTASSTRRQRRLRQTQTSSASSMESSTPPFVLLGKGNAKSPQRRPEPRSLSAMERGHATPERRRIKASAYQQTSGVQCEGW